MKAGSLRGVGRTERLEEGEETHSRSGVLDRSRLAIRTPVQGMDK